AEGFRAAPANAMERQPTPMWKGDTDARTASPFMDPELSGARAVPRDRVRGRYRRYRTDERWAADYPAADPRLAAAGVGRAGDLDRPVGHVRLGLSAEGGPDPGHPRAWRPCQPRDRGEDPQGGDADRGQPGSRPAILRCESDEERGRDRVAGDRHQSRARL